jgi:hypothetical protein
LYENKKYLIHLWDTTSEFFVFGQQAFACVIIRHALRLIFMAVEAGRMSQRLKLCTGGPAIIWLTVIFLQPGATLS